MTAAQQKTENQHAHLHNMLNHMCKTPRLTFLVLGCRHDCVRLPQPQQTRVRGSALSLQPAQGATVSDLECMLHKTEGMLTFGSSCPACDLRLLQNTFWKSSWLLKPGSPCGPGLPLLGLLLCASSRSRGCCTGHSCRGTYRGCCGTHNRRGGHCTVGSCWVGTALA